MPDRIDLAALREQLAAGRGPAYWRSLEELAGTDEFRAALEREFPPDAVSPAGVSRRAFLSVMAASLALAGGVGGCGQPPGEKIVPFVRTPEDMVPGKPLFYATASILDGFATGVLVETHEGRPTKIEGNPGHPASGGASDLFSQASILTLYDPDRARNVTERGEVRQWEDFVRALRAAVADERRRDGAGLRLLTGTVTSPTLAAQLDGVLRMLPRARWHQWEPTLPTDAARAGARLAFGQEVHTIHRLERAAVIVALDADFLACTPARLAMIRDFAAGRRVAEATAPSMNRLYAVEPTLSLTGAKADHRLAVRARDVARVAAALASRLGVDVGALPASAGAGPSRWVDALARDLLAHQGTSAIVAGDGQPAVVHALAHAMNERLGNVGRTVLHTEPVVAHAVDQRASLAELVHDMRAGRVAVLVVLAWNPAYAAPVDLDVGEALQHVAFPAYLGMFADETAVKCRWHVPEAHPLETWSDARAWDGTTTILQPVIAPLYGGKSAHEVLAVFADTGLAASHDVVRDFWQQAHGGADFAQAWHRLLHDGVVPGTAARTVSVAVSAGWARQASMPPTEHPAGLEIVFRPSPTVHDGRFANNGWLQELPQPLTHVTWDNVAMLSPRTAERLGLQSEDIVALRYRGRTVSAPVWVMPGHADDSVGVPIGYGRTLAGRVGNGVGFDAYALRTSSAPWFDDGLVVEKLGRRRRLAVTARQHSVHGRDLVVAGTLAEYTRDRGFVREATHRERLGPGGRALTLYPEYAYDGYRWGMSIDLGACTSCQACVVACDAENNIAVVGREQVLLGRVMHWLRIDTYYAGSLDDPAVYHQPVPCMHCEKAPCEVVCPVNATVHSAEGLNDMVYNRCVGTRYCSNNCPYKVRHFNFLQYADWRTPSLQLQRNPDVTVRSRGVMEKCTYCVQRINAARIAAERDGRRIRDGEVLTACQAACPTSAIVFGDLNDPTSTVHRLKASPLDYALLGELGTQPRTTYLAALRNPNPELSS